MESGETVKKCLGAKKMANDCDKWREFSFGASVAFTIEQSERIGI